MKRYSVLIWSVLVSACAAATVVGCGDDDTSNPDEPSTPEDAGPDSSRTIPARDAAGKDSQQPTTPDTGAHDSAVLDSAKPDALTDAGTPDADADADAGMPDADAGMPDADAATAPDVFDAGKPDADAAPPIDAGDTTICHVGTAANVTSIFPGGAAVAGAKVGYSECAGTVTIAGDGTYAPNVKSAAPGLADGRLTVSGNGFRRTQTGELNAAIFASPTLAGVPLFAVGTGITPYVAGNAHILVAISASGACSKSGNTVAIDGHAEATVNYVNAAGTIGGTSTGTDGLVWISGVNAGGFGTITVTPGVAGCQRDNGFFTGNLLLINDSVTTISVTLKP